MICEHCNMHVGTIGHLPSCPANPWTVAVTRAVVVVVERSPGGCGYYTELAGERCWRPGTLSRVALGWVRRHLVALGASDEECRRVDRLIISELARKQRAEVTAEVPVVDAETAEARVFSQAVALLMPTDGGGR